MQLLNRNLVSVLTAAFAVSGCYRHVPIATPAASTRIIAQVTDTGSVVMANAIGAAATEIEGVLAGVADEAWRIQLVRVDHRGGMSSMWRREEVAFPRIALTNVREKRLDKKRSWLMAGALTAGVVLLSKAFGGLAFGGSTDGEPPPPP
jgi:hypothetical protein